MFVCHMPSEVCGLQKSRFFFFLFFFPLQIDAFYRPLDFQIVKEEKLFARIKLLKG